MGTIIVAGQLLKWHIYPGLFTIWGTTFNTGGEAADEFRAPDPLGRAIVVKGTNANVDTLTDNDGKAVANRAGGKHDTANNLTAGSAPSLTNANKIESVTLNQAPTSFVTGGGANGLNTTTTVTTTNGNVGISAGGAPGGSIGANVANLPFDDISYCVANLLVVSG